MKNNRKKSKIKNIIVSHIVSNKREYIIMTLFLIVGIFLGILYINNVKEEQFNNISQYINSFVEKIKNIENVDSMNMLKSSIISNIILAGILWFFGTTIIGIPVVFGIMAYRGFCLGYTISACVSILGKAKGLAFAISSLLMQNLILIPALLAIGVSGLKLYKSIVKNKKRENIKIEMARHTVFCLFMSILLIIASVIETFISNNILFMIVSKF